MAWVIVVARVRSLAWEHLHAIGTAKRKKKKMKEKNKGKELIIRQATLVLLLVFKYYSATRAPFENIYLCSVTVFKLSESWS